MASTKTQYPKFTKALYKLAQAMGDSGPILFNTVMTNPVDQTAFNLLQSAVITGVQYFPKHTEAS